MSDIAAVSSPSNDGAASCRARCCRHYIYTFFTIFTILIFPRIIITFTVIRFTRLSPLFSPRHYDIDIDAVTPAVTPPRRRARMPLTRAVAVLRRAAARHKPRLILPAVFHTRMPRHADASPPSNRFIFTPILPLHTLRYAFSILSIGIRHALRRADTLH